MPPRFRKIAGLRNKLLVVIAVLFSLSGFLYLNRMVKESDYFKIKEVISNEADARDFFYLKAKNIFALDLKAESSDIAAKYPTYKKIRLIRVLPNRIFINFTKRQPLALVKLSRLFCIDEDMVLFDAPQESATRDLPVILGLENKIPVAHAGARYNIKNLALALNIIKEVSRNNVLREYRMTKVDVANPSNANIFISFAVRLPVYQKTQTLFTMQELEAKIGQYNTRDKINILGDLVAQARNDLGNITYFDLRFREPVIKFKDVQK